MLEKRKKKKKKKRHCSDIGVSRIVLVLVVSNTCRTSTCLQKCCVGATEKLGKGLDQGDSLSLYMFLLCAIGLQGLLHKVESNGSIRGVSICRNGPRVSHLFFLDDSVLFCQAKEIECQVILDILATYEKGSG